MAKLSVSIPLILVALTSLGGCASTRPAPSPERSHSLSVPVTATAATSNGQPAARSEQQLSTQSGHDMQQLRAAVSASRELIKQQLLSHRSYSLVSRDSSASGVSWSYELDVTDNQVVARRYQQWDSDGARMESWSELGDDVGAHQSGPRDNLDKLYDQCLEKVLSQPSEQNDFFVTIGQDGTLSTCVFVPKGCQDDCSQGVVIDEVSWR